MGNIRYIVRLLIIGPAHIHIILVAGAEPETAVTLPRALALNPLRTEHHGQHISRVGLGRQPGGDNIAGGFYIEFARARVVEHLYPQRQEVGIITCIELVCVRRFQAACEADGGLARVLLGDDFLTERSEGIARPVDEKRGQCQAENYRYEQEQPPDIGWAPFGHSGSPFSPCK